jgi:hypothetical protein
MWLGKSLIVSVSWSIPQSIRAFGGTMLRHGATVAREEMDIRYFGMLRLAQHFGATVRARGADGVNAAAALVICSRSMP